MQQLANLQTRRRVTQALFYVNATIWLIFDLFSLMRMANGGAISSITSHLLSFSPLRLSTSASSALSAVNLPIPAALTPGTGGQK